MNLPAANRDPAFHFTRTLRAAGGGLAAVPARPAPRDTRASRGPLRAARTAMTVYAPWLRHVLHT
jgi:hypothetical protein